jgi:hypothetical protein
MDGMVDKVSDFHTYTSAAIPQLVLVFLDLEDSIQVRIAVHKISVFLSNVFPEQSPRGRLTTTAPTTRATIEMTIFSFGSVYSLLEILRART